MIGDFSNQLTGVSNDLLGQYAAGGSPTVSAAQGYLTDTLSSEAGGNPYLQAMIDQTNDSVRRQTQTQLGTRGGIGGSAERDIVSRALAENETGLRYEDYSQDQARKMQAAGLVPSIENASYEPLDRAYQYGATGALLPLEAAALNSNSVGGLLGQYQNQTGTQKTSGGLLGDIIGTGAQFGSAAIMACDERLKENIEWIGATEGGVPLYKFDYIDGRKGVIGPMAQEVAKLQPAAVGPVIDGFMTVDLGELA